MSDQERRPWDRLPNETGKAYEAFRHFLALGPGRSLGKLEAERSGIKPASNRQRKPGGQVGLWSSTYRWVERSRAWDDHLAAEQRLVELEARREEAREWARQRAEALKLDFQVGRGLMARIATRLLDASRPAAAPLTHEELRGLALAAFRAQAIEWLILDRAVPPETVAGPEPEPSPAPAPSATAPVPQSGSLEARADAVLDAWRARQMAAIERARLVPAGGPPDEEPAAV